jgi:hypothetical protein
VALRRVETANLQVFRENEAGSTREPANVQEIGNVAHSQQHSTEHSCTFAGISLASG